MTPGRTLAHPITVLGIAAALSDLSVVLLRFGTFSPFKAIFNSKGPNRGSTISALSTPLTPH